GALRRHRRTRRRNSEGSVWTLRPAAKSSGELCRSITGGQPVFVRTLCLDSLGSALELYDFVILAFFTPVIALAAAAAKWVRPMTVRPKQSGRHRIDREVFE